jgi:hypothetical protein
MKIKCICIDDTGKPEVIPSSKWVKRGEIYHVKHIYKQLLQQGKVGLVLWEIDLKGCEPYNCFLSTRFAFFPEDLQKLAEMIAACSELNNLDIKELLSDVFIRDKNPTPDVDLEELLKV